MATVLWDRKGVLMVELMQQGATVTLKSSTKHLKKAYGHSEQKA
jgi:hypothetical protein